MKKLVLLCLLMPTVFAQQKMWVSDSLRTSVNEEAGLNKRFIATLNAGDEVQKLEISKDGEYTKIKKGEVVGWIHSRNLMNTPSVHVQFAEQSARLEALQQQNQDLNSSQEQTSTTVAQLQNQLAQVQQQAQQARDELLALQRASANVMAIDQRNRELESLIAASEQQNLALRHRNGRLEEALHQRQIYVGGLLVALGFILYWLLDHFRAVKSNRRYFDDFS